MNATPVAQVRAVAEAGEVMPQKSTFFHPKVPTGLALHSLDSSRRPAPHLSALLFVAILARRRADAARRDAEATERRAGLRAHRRRQRARRERDADAQYGATEHRGGAFTVAEYDARVQLRRGRRSCAS